MKQLLNIETAGISNQQVFTLESKIRRGEYSIEDVGDYIPGNVLVTDLDNMSTVYMNKSGCNILKHSAEELGDLGPAYFQSFFVPDEIKVIVSNYLKMRKEQDSSLVYNFVHMVKSKSDSTYKWYFASAKLLYDSGQTVASKILLIVNEVNTLNQIARKINSVLDETDWMKKHFQKFCLLTRREKEIIVLLIKGKTSSEISDILNICRMTVNTHRRNINEKLQITNFSGLYRFASVYGLID